MIQLFPNTRALPARPGATHFVCCSAASCRSVRRSGDTTTTTTGPRFPSARRAAKNLPSLLEVLSPRSNSSGYWTAERKLARAPAHAGRKRPPSVERVYISACIPTADHLFISRFFRLPRSLLSPPPSPSTAATKSRRTSGIFVKIRFDGESDIPERTFAFRFCFFFLRRRGEGFGRKM